MPRNKRAEIRLTHILIAALVLVSSCSTTPEVREQPGPRAATGQEPVEWADEVLVTGANRVEDQGVMDTEFYEGDGSFIDEKAASQRPKPVAEDGEIVLNFEGESIQSVVHTILGEVLQETFVIGPGVSGQVTFATSKPVSRDQLMPILELLLKWNGATLVWHEGRYHVLPVSDAIRGHLYPQAGDSSDVMGYEVRAVPLEYISASEMAKILFS